MATTTQAILALPDPSHHSNSTTAHHRIFSAITSATSLVHLKQIHAQILRAGLDRSNSLLRKLVISSCALSSSLDYALAVFNQITEFEIHICNRLLRELSRSNQPEKTLLVYQKMRMEGFCVDRFSFPPLLKASSRVSASVEGVEIHGLASKLGFDSDPYVQTGLIGMYTACERISDARLVFDKMSYRDVVTWSIMIDSYCQSGFVDDALLLFEEMKSSDVKPDQMVLSTILSACGHARNLNYGKAIHEFINENSIVADPYLQSALVTMYASCGSMDLAQNLFVKMSAKNTVASTIMISGYSKHGQIEAARSIFDQMVEKDLVCWSAMISCYAESDSPQEALYLFQKMQELGIMPDRVTMLSVISACAHLGALDQAKWIHIFVDKIGFGGDLPVNNALIDMYAKCGSLDTAKTVFEKMPRKNVISWTSMITAFAMHGDANDALKFFHQMKAEKIEPNGVTFVGVLYACSHAGLVDEGRKIFSSMSNEYNITPKQEHYGCMVDLFGRASLLREALELIEAMPLAPNVVVWGSLMAACRVHGDTELGEFAAKRLLELEPDHDGAHVLLSNIYAKERRWGDVGAIRKLMKHRGIAKERGYSRIEVNNKILEFLTADRRHRQSDRIYEKVDKVVSELKLVGYVPDTCNVLLDIDEEEKREVILWHSEKLALCYGLITGRKESCIRIVKNLRICEDCHTFMKFVSKVYQRDIVVRDRTRFHHYRGGVCSCKDYW